MSSGPGEGLTLQVKTLGFPKDFLNTASKQECHRGSPAGGGGEGMFAQRRLEVPPHSSCEDKRGQWEKTRPLGPGRPGSSLTLQLTVWDLRNVN